MRSRVATTLVLVVLFTVIPSAMRGKEAIPPEALKKGSELIVVGKVESYRTEEECTTTGRKLRRSH